MTPKAVFTQGSTLKHLLVMTSASAVGLLTLFFVDLVDIYFLSLLGEQELAAAVGFAGTLLFFLTAICIGLQIAMGALVSRAEGAHDRPMAQRYCTNTLWFSGLFAVLVSVPVWWQLESLLSFLGASGRTLQLALAYSNILMPTMAILAERSWRGRNTKRRKITSTPVVSRAIMASIDTPKNCEEEYICSSGPARA